MLQAFSLIQNALPVLGRGNGLPFLKGSAEAGFAVKAGAESNVLDGGLGELQQIFGSGQPGLD